MMFLSMRGNFNGANIFLAHITFILSVKTLQPTNSSPPKSSGGNDDLSMNYVFIKIMLRTKHNFYFFYLPSWKLFISHREAAIT